MLSHFTIFLLFQRRSLICWVFLSNAFYMTFARLPACFHIHTFISWFCVFLVFFLVILCAALFGIAKVYTLILFGSQLCMIFGTFSCYVIHSYVQHSFEVSINPTLFTHQYEICQFVFPVKIKNCRFSAFSLALLLLLHEWSLHYKNVIDMNNTANRMSDNNKMFSLGDDKFQQTVGQ